MSSTSSNMWTKPRHNKYLVVIVYKIWKIHHVIPTSVYRVLFWIWRSFGRTLIAVHSLFCGSKVLSPSQNSYSWGAEVDMASPLITHLSAPPRCVWLLMAKMHVKRESYSTHFLILCLSLALRCRTWAQSLLQLMTSLVSFARKSVNIPSLDTVVVPLLLCLLRARVSEGIVIYYSGW